MPKSHVKPVFVREVGMHPKQYLDRLRVRKASTMLRNSRQSIKEIAASLGYKEQFHFSRRFKYITGFSPQDYRKYFGDTPKS